MNKPEPQPLLLGKLLETKTLKDELAKFNITLKEYRYHSSIIEKVKKVIENFIDNSVNLDNHTSLVVEEFRYVGNKKSVSGVDFKTEIMNSFRIKESIVKLFLENEQLANWFETKISVTNQIPYTIQLEVEYNEPA